MALFFKWLLRVTIAAIGCVCLVGAFFYYVGTRSLPDYDRTVALPGLEAEVEVVRDTFAIPHIQGQSDADVFRALGYAHAQDRLWQMTLLRRTAQGRLSELFGEDTYKIDELLRRLDLYGLAVRSTYALDADITANLEAYAEGVNARIFEINEGALGRGAPEFFLFSPTIAPWQPADSLSILNLMGVQLSSHLEEEVLLARTLLMMDEARVKDLLPDVPGPGVIGLKKVAQLTAPAGPVLASADLTSHPLSPFKARPFAGASNAWAATAERTATRGTLLANDPHLGLTAPSIWYLARLGLMAGPVMGGTIPGVPAVLVGRNDRIGWGLTTAYVDDVDVYIEKVNPDDASQYLTPDGFKSFETRQSIINIKDAQPRTVELQWTENGPVLPGEHYSLVAVTPPGHVTSVAWTLLNDHNTSIQAAMRLMQASTLDDAFKAGQDYVAPAQNLTVADQSRVGLKIIGNIPVRDVAHASQGRIPSQGWIPENRWKGMLPASDNPKVVDPEGGIVGNTNNKTVDAPFPDHVSFVWGDTQRVKRWQRLMQTRRVHTRDSFIEAQLDIVSPTARGLLPLVAADLWFADAGAVPGTPAADRKLALELLSNWNGEMSEHLPEPLIYTAWMRELQFRLIRDDLGPLAEEYTHLEPLFIERVFRNTDGAGAWCDVVQSAPKETCTDIARAALDDAIVWIKSTYGDDLAAVRWGTAHEATHDHTVLGEVPVLNWLVNIRQSTSGGDNTLMRGLTSGDLPHPFRNVHGAGYRGVYDFADPNSSVYMISTGQSGHPFSRHYDDLATRWRRGEYVPMSLDLDLARAANVGVTRLVPGSQ